MPISSTESIATSVQVGVGMETRIAVVPQEQHQGQQHVRQLPVRAACWKPANHTSMV